MTARLRSAQNYGSVGGPQKDVGCIVWPLETVQKVVFHPRHRPNRTPSTWGDKRSFFGNNRPPTSHLLGGGLVGCIKIILCFAHFQCYFMRHKNICVLSGLLLETGVSQVWCCRSLLGIRLYHQGDVTTVTGTLHTLAHLQLGHSTLVGPQLLYVFLYLCPFVWIHI